MQAILACDYFDVLDLLMLDAYKNCQSYYFVRVRGFTAHELEDSRPVTFTTFAVPPQCYYLGKYPIYWSEEEMGVLYAHSKRTKNMYAFGPKPWVSFVDMSIFQYVERDRWDIYLPKVKIESYLAQEKFLRGRELWQLECIAKNYPPPKIKPPAKQKKVYLPEGTFDWPGIPTTELELPLPEQASSLIPGWPRLYIIFWAEAEKMIIEMYYDWGPPPPEPILPK
jgi:hypothetical protein